MDIDEFLQKLEKYKSKDTPKGIFRFEKGQGENIVILCCVHGNETIGLDVMRELIPILYNKMQLGIVTIILVNIYAVMQNVRFINQDMNRILSENLILNIKNKTKKNNEEERLLEILPFIENCDILLDIHSTIMPSTPFIYCKKSDKHFKIAELFDTEFIVSPGLNLSKNDIDIFSSFDSFADRSGGIGITVESGMIGGEISPLNRIISLLKLRNIIKNNANDKILKFHNKSQIKLEIYSKITAKTNNFSFNGDIKNFQFYHKNDVFAKDGVENLKIMEDSFVIFPKKNIKIGDMCCFLVRKYE